VLPADAGVDGPQHPHDAVRRRGAVVAGDLPVPLAHPGPVPADRLDLAAHPVRQVLGERVAVAPDGARRPAVAPRQVRLQRLGQGGRPRLSRPPGLAGVLAPPHRGERVGRHPARLDLGHVRPVADPYLDLLAALDQRLSVPGPPGLADDAHEPPQGLVRVLPGRGAPHPRLGEPRDSHRCLQHARRRHDDVPPKSLNYIDFRTAGERPEALIFEGSRGRVRAAPRDTACRTRL
jgi:hypothetical protein